MANEVVANVKNLKTLIGYLAGGLPKVRVGILGSTSARTSGELNNAEIGYTNEVGKKTGYPKIPRRSFLVMPLTQYFYEKLKGKKTLASKMFEKAIKEGTADKFMQKVGFVAEETIQEAFSTNGYGQWKPNAPRTVAQKKSDSPLIDTGQLRRSITSKVVK